MKYLMSLMAVLIMFSATESSAQNEKVRLCLKMVALGQIQDVKMELPDLLAQYPHDPGVMLLHGVVIQDAERALEKYIKIVEKYPQNEWADDASWRIVQYYAIAGDTILAKRALKNYRNNYPTSQFLVPATDVVRLAVSKARTNTDVKVNVTNVYNTEPAPVKMKVDIITESAEPVALKANPVPPSSVRRDVVVKDLENKKAPELKPVVNTNRISSLPQTPKEELQKAVSEEPAVEESDDDEIVEVVVLSEEETEATEEVKETKHTEVTVVNSEVPEKETYVYSFEKKTEEVKDPSAPKKYGLQVGIYSTYEAAKFEQEKFRAQRMLAVVEQKMVDGETMYAVVIGDYSSEESAETAKAVVQQQCKCLPIVFMK